MPVLTKIEGSLAITPGQYLLKLQSCEVVEGKNYTTQLPEDQLKWVWVIEKVMELDPSDEQAAHVGEEVWEWTSVRCTPMSKATSRAEALLGRALAINEEIDTDLLVGRRLKATYAPYQRANGQQGTKIGLVQVYQAPKMAGGAPAAAAVGDPRQSDQLKADLKAAYEAAIAAKTWGPDDIAGMLRDLYGKQRSADLTADQAATMVAVLRGQRDIHINSEGAWTLDLPF